jgi:hypothetical protein
MVRLEKSYTYHLINKQMKKNVADTSIAVFHQEDTQRQRIVHMQWYARRAVEMDEPFCIGTFDVLYGEGRDMSKDTPLIHTHLAEIAKPKGLVDSKISARINDLRKTSNLIVNGKQYEIVFSHKAPSPKSNKMVNWYTIKELMTVTKQHDEPPKSVVYAPTLF